MCDDFEWDSDDYEIGEARRKFKSAMVQKFNDLYGTDEKDLNSLQNLCHILNFEPAPEGLKEYREVSICRVPFIMAWIAETDDDQRVRQTHVNLVDLVDTPRTGASVKVFPNLKKLQVYTIKNEKYFPKEDAYASGLLRFLLREILHSYAG